MTKKNIKRPIIIVFVLLLLALASYLAFYLLIKKTANNQSKSSRTAEVMSADDRRLLNLDHLSVYAVVSRDKAGKINEYKVIDVKDPQPLKLEWLSETEKTPLTLVCNEGVLVFRLRRRFEW